MIGYRFLPPAEDEMSEAALFYDAASVVWEKTFLLTFNSGLIGYVSIPRLARQ